MTATSVQLYALSHRRVLPSHIRFCFIFLLMAGTISTPSGYTAAFERAGANCVPVTHIFSQRASPLDWRLLVLQKICWLCCRFAWYLNIWCWTWLGIRLFVKLFARCGLGSGSWGTSWHIYSWIVVFLSQNMHIP